MQIRGGIYVGLLGMLVASACGGSTSGESDGAAASVVGACERAAECGADRSECIEDGNRAREEAVRAGCTGTWNDLVACVERNGFECQSGPSQSCEPEAERLNDCVSGSDDEDCATSGGSGGSGNGGFCTVECSDYAASCRAEGPGPQVTCACTAGPNAGTEFVADGCVTAYIDVADTVCR